MTTVPHSYQTIGGPLRFGLRPKPEDLAAFQQKFVDKGLAKKTDTVPLKLSYVEDYSGLSLTRWFCSHIDDLTKRWQFKKAGMGFFSPNPTRLPVGSKVTLYTLRRYKDANAAQNAIQTELEPERQRLQAYREASIQLKTQFGALANRISKVLGEMNPSAYGGFPSLLDPLKRFFQPPDKDGKPRIGIEDYIPEVFFVPDGKEILIKTVLGKSEL